MTNTKIKSSQLQPLRITDDELTINQRRDNGRTLTYGFDSGSLPAGYTWAGSPFGTPATVDLTNNPSFLRLSHTGAIRSFLYTTTIPNSSLLPILRCGWLLGAASQYVGLRIDDGTDGSYFEWLLSGDLKGTVRSRVGSGSIRTSAGSAMPIPTTYDIRANRTGTKYSSWNANLFFAFPWTGVLIQSLQTSSGIGNVSWTPARWGFVFEITVSGYAAMIDALYDS